VSSVLSQSRSNTSGQMDRQCPPSHIASQVSLY
jgi:hypothetical protein